MATPKHKGNEFSNISQVWEQNEKKDTQQEGSAELGTEFSNVTEVWQQNENAANADNSNKNDEEEKA